MKRYNIEVVWLDCDQFNRPHTSEFLADFPDDFDIPGDYADNADRQAVDVFRDIDGCIIVIPIANVRWITYNPVETEEEANASQETL